MANFNVAKTFDTVPHQGLPYNRQLIITAANIVTAATANSTANSDTLTFRAVVPAGSIVRDVVLVNVTPFVDQADTGFDSLTASVGDGTSNLNHIPAKEMALLGTEIAVASNDNAIAALTIGGTYSQSEVQALRAATATLGGRTYASADYVTVLLTPKSGKNLSALDVGELRVYLQLINKTTLGVTA